MAARDAQSEMERVLHTMPLPPQAASGWADIAARRWRHGALHDRVGPMREHVAMAYRGPPRRIEWRQGRHHLRSATTGDAVTLIPAGSAARWDIGGALDVVHLYVAPERLRRVAEEAGLGSGWALAGAVASADRGLSDLIRLLGDTVIDANTIDRLYADTLSELLCLHLVRGYGLGAAPPAQSRADGLAPWQVRRICDYLMDQLDRQVGLAELAGLVDLSAKHVCTAFRLATGEPPHRWMRLRRVEEAKRRLRETRQSVLTIALDLGYTAETAFGAMFLRETGMSPGAYRRGTGGGADAIGRSTGARSATRVRP